MISKTKTIVSTVLALVLLLITPMAVAATTTPDASSSSAPKTTKTLADRIAARKTAFTTKLSDAEQAALKIKCKPAQTKTIQLVASHTKQVKDRQDRYNEIVEKFEAIIGKLEVANFDTKDLAAKSVELQQYIDTFNKDIIEYKAALADVNEVDCIVDPVGYRASLEAARQARVVVAKDAAVIRSYISDTIQPALAAAKASLTTEEGTN